jgi:hypothetical protein
MRKPHPRFEFNMLVPEGLTGGMAHQTAQTACIAVHDHSYSKKATTNLTEC